MTAELTTQTATGAGHAGGRTPQGPATVDQLAGGARRMIHSIVTRATGGHAGRAEPVDPYSLARWASEVRKAVDAAEADAVAALRAEGFSWQEIADGFDYQRQMDGQGTFSKQAAIKKWNHR